MASSTEGPERRLDEGVRRKDGSHPDEGNVKDHPERVKEADIWGGGRKGGSRRR